VTDSTFYIDRNTGSFTIEHAGLQEGENHFELIANTSNTERKLLEGRFFLENKLITLKEGDSLINSGKTMYIDRIYRRSVNIREEGLTVPVNVGRKYFLGEAVVEIIGTDPANRTAEARLTIKKCPQEDGKERESIIQLANFSSESSGGFGYKNLLLDPEVGYTPSDITVGIPIIFPISTADISCGWYYLQDLSFLQDSLFSIVYTELRALLREKIRNGVKINVVLIDPFSRHYINELKNSKYRYKKETQLAIDEKLPNPDIIIDLVMKVGCCSDFGFSSCFKTPLELFPKLLLVDAKNGLILESFDPKVDVLKRHQKDICLDPTSANFNNERMSALVEFIEQGMDHLSDYFVYFHLK
jgi:hypothetical protein